MSGNRAAWGWNRLGIPLTLAAVFAAPLLLAWLVYGRPGWQPSASLAQGELMRPIRRLPVPSLLDRDGKPLDGTLFRGRWSLLYVSPDACATDCTRLLDTLRRICRARAKGEGRLQRVLMTPRLPADTADRLLRTDSGLRLAVLKGDWPLAAGQVYLIDPLGNLVLRYPPGFAPDGLAKDLARLLRLSGIG